MIERQYSFEAIGTYWSINTESNIPDKSWKQLLQNLSSCIEQFDKNYSRFRSDSLVTVISKQVGTYDLPEDGYKLMSFYEKLYQVSDGLVTPLIGQTLSDAGYGADYSFVSKELTTPPNWDEALQLSKDNVKTKQLVMLDFGAAGKGYLVDLIGDIFKTNKVFDFTINAGGDILHRSSSNKTVTVGLENPLDRSQALGVVELHSGSLCASSGNIRKWGKYHHILNPESLESPTEIIATWVIADNAMTADGIATALFFVAPQKLLSSFKFDYAVLHKDMTMSYSPSFPAELFESTEK